MAAAREWLVGIDLGTSSVKVAAVGLDGKIAASASREYPLRMPKPGWSEQNPDDWWTATVACLRTLVKKVDPARILAISFSGQMHGSVFLDARDKPIRPALLWNDSRTAAQCAAIAETLGAETLQRVFKNDPLTSYTLPKVLWLRDNEPARFKKLRAVLLPKDYIRFRLTGVKSMEESDGAGTLMMEVGRKHWAIDALRKLDLDPVFLPLLTHSTDVVGRVTAKAAHETGLRHDTLVVAGGGDQPVGAVGVGVYEEGQAMVSLGTSGVVLAPTRIARESGPDGLASFDHAVPGVSYLMGCVLSAGASLRWHRDTICAEEVQAARRQGVDPYGLMLKEAAKIPIGAENLLFAPYLTGERTPHPNPFARGAFVGLTARHARAHLTRAVVEGVSFALRDCLELIRAKGVDVRQIRACGGGARSKFWLQMLADVLQLPVAPVESPDAAACGAAILAGIGAGVYKDFAEASAKAVRAGDPLRPRKGAIAAAYAEAYERYRKLYPALRELFPRD